jgi:transcriptional regulator with XRE-family HTH domain
VIGTYYEADCVVTVIGNYGQVAPAQLAERADVATATVARIERNEIEPRMTTLGKLAQALEVDPAELVED